MWDSFESVWLQANKDKSCSCVVLPIPYFDKTSEGMLGEMHYEGDMFPEYVPITDYNSYDLAIQKPDIIYFHNPYDQYNFVTSVHPYFYSKQLKKYTDMLVYIPYFAGLDDVADHLCENVGVVRADLVIVQSNNIKKIYQKYVSEEKILDLGSPKIDKMIFSPEKYRMPADWKEIIGEKKVILYNTHLDSIINHGDMFLKKLKFVFSKFAQNESVVLLWRPHPLSKETALTLKPTFYKEYNEIERKFVDERKGILDCTPDLHRALSISDGYYGDWSSLVALYGVTKKPIMIQNLDIIKDFPEEELYSLLFEDIVFDNNKIWFASSNYNGLFKFDLSDYVTEYLGDFPEEEGTVDRLYSGITRYKNKLVFAPMGAKDIAIYDVDLKKFNKINVKNMNLTNTPNYYSNLKFYSLLTYQKWVFLIGCSYPAIIRMDMENGEMNYFDEWINDIKDLLIDQNEIYFLKPCIVGKKLYLATCNSNVIMEFDMETCTHKLYQIKECDYTFSSICYYNNEFWIAPRKKGTYYDGI